MKLIFYPIIILILSFWALQPLLSSGYFPLHDATQIERVYEMKQAIADGQFPVRIVKDLGYGFGYPIFNFYSPLPYYLGGMLALTGIDVILSTKIMFIIGILISSITMFFLGKHLFGKLGGLISAVFYTYAPYHALDIYVRGAVGEYYAYAFLPLLFFGLLKNGLLTTAFSLALIILSHNITAMIVAGFFVLYMLFNFLVFRNLRKLSSLLLAFCLGLAISAFFWLPAVFEASFTNVQSQISGGADFHKHFIYLDQLWDWPWGFGGSAGRQSGMSFKIGKIHLIAGLLGIICIFLKKIKWKKEIPFFIFILIILASSVFLLLPGSVFIWEAIPLMAYIQYPWRFLVFIVFSLSLFSGGVLIYISRRSLRIISTLSLLIILLVFGIKYFQPKEIFTLDQNKVISKENLRWQVSKISDEYLPIAFNKPKDKNQVASSFITSKDGFAVKKEIRKSNRASAEIITQKSGYLLLNIAYFPGWQVYVNGKVQNIILDQGLIKIEVPKGISQVEAKFTNTPIRNIGNTITILTCIALFVLKYFRKISL